MEPIRSSHRLAYIGIISLLLLTMCRSYKAEPIDYENGLVCQAYTDYFKDGSSIDEGNECKFTCPDGLVLIVNESKISDPKADLRDTFCKVALTVTASPLPPTQTQMPISGTPLPSTETPLVTSTPVQPLLSEITTCNGYASFINFRFVEPVPDLQGKNLVVTIDDRIVECGVDPAFTSILTCDLPPFISYPASVLVTLNHVPVNEFQLDPHTCTQDVATKAILSESTDSPETTPVEPEATDVLPTENPTEESPVTPPG
jgi:hypothetical protein